MGLRKFAGEVVKEGKRVRWPKKETLIPAIIVVVIIAVVAGLILAGEDLAGRKILEILENAGKGA